MKVTDKNLERFRQWLTERGRSEDTATLYITNVRTCMAHPKGMTHRLVSGELAPNTVRTNLQSLRAWATFQGDDATLRVLKDIRLPPARRVRSKPPLDSQSWRLVVNHLKTCPMEPEAMRYVLLIMAQRGLRSGDVLRMRRPDVVKSLTTGRLIYEGKGRKRTEIAITTIREQLEALAKITGWDRVRDLICTGKSPRSLSRKVGRAAKRTAAQVGLPDMNPHRYRHTFATRFLDKLRGDPNAIVKLTAYMGWESINTAARYVSSVSMEELDQVGTDLVSALNDPSQ